MRVKKLNTNRRHKAGEDDVVVAGENDQQQKWVSPTKEQDDLTSSCSTASSGGSSPRGEAHGVEFGSSSPTDPSSVLHQVPLNHHFAGHSSQSPSNQEQYTRGGSSAPGGASIVKTMAPMVMSARDSAGRSGVLSSPFNSKTTSSPSSSWRNHVGDSVRQSIHAKIVETLKTLKPNAPEKVLERLPGLAYRMEESLFKMAKNLDEYTDQTTLPQRLNLIQENNAKRLLQQHSPGTKPKDTGANVPKPLTEEQSRVVFHCLQTWRQKLVNMYGVAPWEILPNQTLAKVAVYVPSTEQELSICGVHDEQLARFGSSLLQELQRITQRNTRTPMASGSVSKRGFTADKNVKGGRKAGTSAKNGDAKKRKTNGEYSNSNLAGNPRLVPAPPANFAQPPGHPGGAASLLTPSQLLFRPGGMDTLPTLLPSATSSTNSGNSKSPFASANARLSPAAQIVQQPFFSRLQQNSQQDDPSNSQETNHMHLLAQGVGHVSKQQQDTKTVEMYEKEIQTLRWMLHQSQQEKTQLELEVQRLRSQLTRHNPNGN